MPLLHVTAINKKKPGDDKSVYSCPVYKYAKRTDKYLIFRVNLNSETDLPSKWKLKGVTLLCAKEWFFLTYIYIYTNIYLNKIKLDNEPSKVLEWYYYANRKLRFIEKAKIGLWEFIKIKNYQIRSYF